MSGETSRVKILRISKEKAERLHDLIVREIPVTIFFNDVDLVTLMCSPKDLDYLAIGFLFGEGLIKSKRDVKSVFADEEDGAVWVETRQKKDLPANLLSSRFITTGCGKGFTFVNAAGEGVRSKVTSRTKVPVDAVRKLMKDFQERSRVYKLTGGVHGAALCSSKNMLVFNEDIGRHNAIDKVFGECIMKGIETEDRILITSGRISSEILAKAARIRVPIVVSKSAPTALGVKLATDLGITLVGFVRGSRMNVYSNAWRITGGSDAP